MAKHLNMYATEEIQKTNTKWRDDLLHYNQKKIQIMSAWFSSSFDLENKQKYHDNNKCQG